jgi:AcrR family transcriptional regulator
MKVKAKRRYVKVAQKAARVSRVPVTDDARTKGDFTRERILRVGADILSRQQYRSITIRQVAHEADISLGSVYFHFTSKEELVAAILVFGIRQNNAQVEAALAALPPHADSRARIFAAVEAFLTVIVTEGDYAQTLRILRDDSVPQRVWARYRVHADRSLQIWLDLFRRAQEDGTMRFDIPPVLLTFSIMGAVGWANEWYDPKRMSTRRIARYFSDFLLNGMVVKRPRAAR